MRIRLLPEATLRNGTKWSAAPVAKAVLEDDVVVADGVVDRDFGRDAAELAQERRRLARHPPHRRLQHVDAVAVDADVVAVDAGVVEQPDEGAAARRKRGCRCGCRR